MISDKKLLEYAKDAMLLSYSPYSDFKVGAALLCDNDQVFTGCNIENSAYSATVCAERTAFFKAKSSGCSGFTAIAVVGGKSGIIEDFCPPCGVCRQVMNEFCNQEFRIILTDGKTIKTYILEQLLPLGFGRNNLCI